MTSRGTSSLLKAWSRGVPQDPRATRASVEAAVGIEAAAATILTDRGVVAAALTSHRISFFPLGVE